MNEWYAEKGGLISEEEWKETIGLLLGKSAVITDEGSAVKSLSPLFLSAVEKRIPEGKFGVLFSGGIDSTLISFAAKNLGKKPICFAVGNEGSDDLLWAKKASEALGLELVSKVFSEQEFKDAFFSAVKILKTDDPVRAEIAAVTYCASVLAKEHGCTVLFSGLGSEEVFAGYERHLIAFKEGRDVNDECRKGLIAMYKRDITRDFSIAKSLEVDIRTPFLDKGIIRFGMTLPQQLKIDENQKKIIIRKMALSFGLPEEFCFRKKKSAQYGSGFDKMLFCLARKNDFSSKGQYVKSLIEKN
jgi:asparagine synthetase B (glutamine-hydrolysing)